MTAQQQLAQQTVNLLQYALTLDQANQNNTSSLSSYLSQGGLFDRELMNLHSERHTLAQQLGQALDVSDTLAQLYPQIIEWRIQVEEETEKASISDELVQKLMLVYDDLQAQLAKNTEFLKKSSSQVEDLK